MRPHCSNISLRFPYGLMRKEYVEIHFLSFFLMLLNADVDCVMSLLCIILVAFIICY